MDLELEVLQRVEDGVLRQPDLEGMLDNNGREWRNGRQRGQSIRRELISPYKFNQKVASNLSGYEEEIAVPEDSKDGVQYVSVPDTLERLGGVVLVDYSTKEAAYLQDRDGEEGVRVATFGDLQGVDQSLRRISHRYLSSDNDPVIDETVSYRSDSTGIIPDRSNYDHKVPTDLDTIE